MSSKIDGRGSSTVLQVDSLRVSLTSDPAGDVLRGVSLRVGGREMIGIVGESGSGKSTLALAIMRMLPPSLRVVSGSIFLEGRDIYALSRVDMRLLRGRRLALVVQDAMAAMNPVTTVEEQLAEVVRDHEGGNRQDIRRRSVEALHRLGMLQPQLVMRKYAHELSGGMQQRVAIASAVILRPAVLVADEPTTALDATLRAQTFAMFHSIRKDSGTSIILISHDLAAVRHVCDRILVMYAGIVVESGPTNVIFSSAQHPYTQALLAASPTMNETPPERLFSLGGLPPAPSETVSGCRFRPRCPLWIKLHSPSRCVEDVPTMGSEMRHAVACHFASPQAS